MGGGSTRNQGRRTEELWRLHLELELHITPKLDCASLVVPESWTLIHIWPKNLLETMLDQSSSQPGSEESQVSYKVLTYISSTHKRPT